MTSPRLFRLLLALAAVVFAHSAQAHDPGLSSADLALDRSEARVVLTFNPRDLASVSTEPLERLAPRAAELSLGGKSLPPKAIATRRDRNENDELTLVFDLPRNARELVFRSPLLSRLPYGHRQSFVAKASDGKEMRRRLLSASDDTVSVPLAVNAAPQLSGSSFFDFLLLGIRHILTGYDHLLFLFALLVMCRDARAAALLITCFTAAHSLTLALATFGVVTLPSRFVESAIALSILYVGIENLIYRERAIPARWALTFLFGLVHGLGFASVLREMGIASRGAAAAIPLVGFNLGVELGQLSVAAIVLPVIWSLRRNPRITRVAIPACSALVAVAGASWLLARAVF